MLDLDVFLSAMIGFAYIAAMYGCVCLMLGKSKLKAIAGYVILAIATSLLWSAVASANDQAARLVRDGDSGEGESC